MRWLVLAVLAGCYSPTLQAGGACEDVCPGDLVCIDHVCLPPGTTPHPDASNEMGDAAIDARTIDGPPGDADGDGLLDNTDNCSSKANVDQHDEDADAIGDVCDPCPHINGDAADGDGDGVGDACDPQPAIAKQQIVFFDPFTSAKAEWTVGTGASRVGETYRISGTDGDSELAVANGEARIEMGGTIAAVSSSGPHQLSIEFAHDATGNKFHYTEFYDDTGAGGDVAISKANDASYTSLATTPYPNALPTGAWSMRIDESVAAQQIKLRAKLGGVQYNEITGATNLASPSLTAASTIKFYVQHADVRFDYVIVITTVP